jgi:hypothetical protein
MQAQGYIQDEMLALKILFVLSPFTEKTKMVQKPASHAPFFLYNLSDLKELEYSIIFFIFFIANHWELFFCPLLP